MASLIPVRKSQIKPCRTCAAPIALVKNSKGKWFAVDVFKCAATGEEVYRAGVGMHRNLTLWHRCSTSVPSLHPEVESPADPLKDRKRALWLRVMELSGSGIGGDDMAGILKNEFADLEAAA